MYSAYLAAIAGPPSSSRLCPFGMFPHTGMPVPSCTQRAIESAPVCAPVLQGTADGTVAVSTPAEIHGGTIGGRCRPSAHPAARHCACPEISSHEHPHENRTIPQHGRPRSAFARCRPHPHPPTRICGIPRITKTHAPKQGTSASVQTWHRTAMMMILRSNHNRSHRSHTHSHLTRSALSTSQIPPPSERYR